VRGEVSLLGYNEDMSAKIAAEVIASVVFSEMIRNIIEELRYEYSWKNQDGTTGFGVTFFLMADKTELEKEISDAAKAVSSGNNRDNLRTDSDNPVEKTTDICKISESIDSESFEPVKAVKELMAGNSRIQRYREDNRQLLRLLGFEN